MKTADDKALSVFVSLEERNNKNTAMANDTPKRLESGGERIARQHDDIQKAFEGMNKVIEETRMEMNHDSANTKQYFLLYIAHVQQGAQNSKTQLKRSADDV